MGPGGAAVEIFLLRAENDQHETQNEIWRCLVKPGKRVRRGDVILLPQGLRAEILSMASLVNGPCASIR